MSVPFRFAHPWALCMVILVVVFLAVYRLRYYRNTRYRHSLASELKQHVVHAVRYPQWVVYALRALQLIILAIMVGKPQLIDQKSNVFVHGVDILLVLDVSGSMAYFDDLHDRRPRIAIAKHEALNFIKKRENDQIGLVLFGADAVSRCPLTLDKKIVRSILEEVELGVINPQGTALCAAIALGVQRLRKAQADNKVMIVLTDGEPSPGDLDPSVAIDLAKKYGIKIYTIGIGSTEGAYVVEPLFGVRRVPIKLNKKLLAEIAQRTGGRFFEARLADDIKHVYDTIDALEKTEYETSLLANYYDIFLPFFVCVMALLIIEQLLCSFVWFCL